MAANYAQISATTQVKTSAGKLKGIFVSAASGTPTITVYDEIQGGTTRKIIDTFTPVAATMYPVSGDEGGILFSHGLNVAIGGTVSTTIIYE